MPAATVTLRRGPSAPRRGGVLVPPRRAVDRQRPARVPALLRSTTAGCWSDSASPTRSCCSAVSTSRSCAPTAQSARLRRLPGVPAPVHLTAALAGYGLLSPLDRLRGGPRRAGAATARSGEPGARRRRRSATFLRRHGQNDATIDALWGIVATATLNLAPDEASLALAAKVFRTGLLDHAPAADVGYAAVPLGELHSTATLGRARRTPASRCCSRTGSTQRRGRVGAVASQRSGAVREPGSADDVVLAAAAPRRVRGAAGDCARPRPARADAARRGADRQRPRHLRPQGHRPAVRGRRRLARAVVLRPDRHVRVCTHHAGQYLAITVSAADGVIDDAEPRRCPSSSSPSWHGCCPPRGRADGPRRVRHPRTASDVPAGRRVRAALRPQRDVGLDGVWLAGAWTAPAGRTRWKARCAAE